MVRIEDSEMTETIQGISGEMIYRKEYQVDSEFLIPNYNYSFSVRAHYHNDWFNEKSDWTKTFDLHVDAPIPENLNINYNNNNDIMTVTWDKTQFYNLPISYTLKYSYNSIDKEIDTQENTIFFNGRELPGGADVIFSVKANYPKFSSKYTSEKTVTIPHHKPINIIIHGYLEGNVTNEKATSIHINWDPCVGAINYNVKRFDLYYANTNISTPDLVDTTNTNSYIDETFPLGGEPIIPRRYIYKISANY